MTTDVFVVTGATRGIGRSAAERLAAQGRTVVVTGRDRSAGETVAATVTDAAPDARGRFIRSDLSDLDAVRDLARTVRADYDRLDGLVNNAGTLQRARHLTSDGIEMTFAVNHVAPFLLTALLAPRLCDAPSGIVLTTTSGLHRNGDLTDLDAVIDGREFDGQRAYANSKLANVLFTYELATRLADEGVAATCYHPGWVPGTGLFRATPVPVSGLMRIAGLLASAVPFGPLRTPVQAGADLTHILTEADLPIGTGSYYRERERTAPAADAEDEPLRERLWTVTAELVDVPPAVPAVDPLA